MIKKLMIKYKEVINYVLVGALTTIVSLVSYYLCVVTFLEPTHPIQLQIANIISWICAVSFAYWSNRKYVFESKNSNKISEVLKFISSRVSTLLIDIASMATLVTVLAVNDKISKLLVQVIVFFLNYIFSKYFVFRNMVGGIK